MKKSIVDPVPSFWACLWIGDDWIPRTASLGVAILIYVTGDEVEGQVTLATHAIGEQLRVLVHCASQSTTVDVYSPLSQRFLKVYSLHTRNRYYVKKDVGRGKRCRTIPHLIHKEYDKEAITYVHH